MRLETERGGPLRSTERTKLTCLFINEDPAAQAIEKRNNQLERLRSKESRKIAYFVLDKLIIVDSPQQESR